MAQTSCIGIDVRPMTETVTDTTWQDMDLPSSSDSEEEVERHHGFVDGEDKPLEEKVKVSAYP